MRIRQHKKQIKSWRIPIKIKRLKINKSNASKGVMLIKEQKQTTDSFTQYSPKGDTQKTQTKEIGILVTNNTTFMVNKKSTVSIGWETEITMNSKELPTILNSIQNDLKMKKPNNNSGKQAKTNIEEFQDVELDHYDLKDYK